MDYEIRTMVKSDVPTVYAVECACFRSPWSKMALYGELRNDVAHYRVLTIDGTIIGYASMWVLFEEAHVMNVAILPDYRRHGYGKALLIDLMECASRLGAHVMTLEVRENNLTAQGLYRDLAFVQEGRRPRYYDDTGEAALLLCNADIQKTLEMNGRKT